MGENEKPHNTVGRDSYRLQAEIPPQGGLSWLAGGVELMRSRAGEGRELVRTCIFPLPEGQGRRISNIIPHVRAMCAPGSKVWTDELNLYGRLGGFVRHGTVCH